ncbi:MAG TPA: dihydroneopterin aldolase, partial [Polyangiaceae bacterium]|nr:dihydroneopterin aldolase [Polyangiaceae bacterium]
ELECIVGVRPPERKRRQRVRLDVSLFVDLSPAGRSGRITRTIDYARVADELQNMLRFREYRLMESAAEELSAMLFAAHPPLQAVELCIEKPEALRGRATGTGAVRVRRDRESFPITRRQIDGGFVDLVLETHEATLSLVTLDAAKEFSSVARACVVWLTHGDVGGTRSQMDLGEPIDCSTPIVAGPNGATLFVCQIREDVL